MAVTYGFFNSVNGDRKYNADQMSEYFRGIVSQGVFQHLDSGMAVSAGTGLSVSVAAGRAIIQNRWVQNSAALNLTISDASETYGRKDAVVIRLNKSSRAISIAVKTGTPAASPVAPSMTRDETTYEMALAYVNVAAGASSVTVTDKRSDSSVCGWASVAQATSGEVDQMLNAMKTGFDGVVYSSPAAMVQGCDTKLQTNIDELKDSYDISVSTIKEVIYTGTMPQVGWVGPNNGRFYTNVVSLKNGDYVTVLNSQRYPFTLGFVKKGDSTIYQATWVGANQLDNGYKVLLTDDYDGVSVYSDNSAATSLNVVLTLVRNPYSENNEDFSIFNGLTNNSVYPYVQMNMDLKQGDKIGIQIMKNTSSKFNRYILYYSTTKNAASSQFDQATAVYFYDQIKEFVVPQDYKCVRLVANLSEAETGFDFKCALYKILDNDPDNIAKRESLPRPKTFSVLGDSWSAYKKYLNPSTNRGFYPPWETDVDGRTSGSDVTEAEYMWWYKLSQYNKIKLVENNSYSGSPICFDGLNSGTADAKTYSFATRVTNMISADVFFVLGGTNDATSGATIGESKYSQWSDDDLIQFKPAVCFVLDYIKTRFPLSEVYFMIPPDLNVNYKNAIIDVCDHYSVPYVILSGMSYLGYHPDAASQEKIGRYASRMLVGFEN